MTIPQWALRTDGDLEIVDIPDPNRRPTAQPATVPPPTDKKSTSLIEQEARAALQHIAYSGRMPQGEGRAFIVGYQAGYAAAWEASGAHYYLDRNGDGTYTRKATP